MSSRSIQVALATVAGAVAFYIGYRVTAPVILYLLKLLAGDPQLYVEMARDFGNSLFTLVLGLFVGFLAGRFAFNRVLRLFEAYGVPGLVTPVQPDIADLNLAIHLHANGLNDVGDLARLELFSRTIKAGRLMQFMHGESDEELVIKGDNGLYLVLGKRCPSPYDELGSADDTITVRLRTRRNVLHSFESLYGVSPTFTIRESQPMAYYRLSLDYLGSDTEVLPMLNISGPKQAMAEIFLREPSRQEEEKEPETEQSGERRPGRFDRDGMRLDGQDDRPDGSEASAGEALRDDRLRMNPKAQTA